MKPRMHALSLPFAAPAPPPAIVAHWQTYLIGGRLVRCIGQRWGAAEAASLPFAAEPDPIVSGQYLSLRLVDLVTGETLTPVSDAELSCRLARSPKRGA